MAQAAVIRKVFQYGEHTVTLETGKLARQATGSVLASMGDTVVLVTVVAVKGAVEGRDFFPLTVNYQERSYAAGKIPGGYFKREGRPSEKEILTSRLIDRPLRPLFPEDFKNEIQIVVTVLSVDTEIDPDIVSLLGASAALAISGVPFKGPVGAARVGYQNGVFSLNPTLSQLKTSDLDLVVAGTENAVLMVESEANQLPENIMLSAVMFGHEQMKAAIQAIKEFAGEAGTTAWEWQASARDEALAHKVSSLVLKDFEAAYQIAEKQARLARIAEIKAAAVANLLSESQDVTSISLESVNSIFEHLESSIVRSRIINGECRIDGRDTKTVRPINIHTGILPRTHGSVVFTRGETQALVVTTLGTAKDAQIIDALEGDSKEAFMLHYNFPPYCVGETGQMGNPKRREIGHGRLAKRAIQPILPSAQEFNYVLRVVSEITESNGSSSMATVCGASLSLMDAGVPIKSAVAGIAMGLIKEGDKFAILTDILGDEDHLGDMDFKVAGTENGITALQMDIKIDGITKEIMEAALEQAKDGRLHILKIMNQALRESRKDVSEFAPRIITMKIPRDKIRDVIGKGGATIRAIIESTGASIDISDDGVVNISAIDSQKSMAAQKEVERLTADVEVGKIYEGTVVRVMDFGAFVTIIPGRDGLVHISQISDEHVKDVNAFLKEGQAVRVKVLEIDKQGRIRLSMKEAMQEKEEVTDNN